MNTSFYIAKRYLFSKKSFQAINFITAISVLGVFVGSAALVVILSVFNGFEEVVLSMYNSFTPELRIEPSSGKTFSPDMPLIRKLKHDARVLHYSDVLEEKVVMRYDRGQFIGWMKGVSDGYGSDRLPDSSLLEGTFALQRGGRDYAVIGAGVQNFLRVNVDDDSRYLEIFAARRGSANALNPADIFNRALIAPSGVFSVQKEFDDRVIVPLRFARTLLEEEGKVTSVELNVGPKYVKQLQQELLAGLPASLTVKNRVQQDQGLYKTLNTEKISIYVILTFVLVIAIFNIIGSLTMLVIDKRKDIAILSSIGASAGLIRNIFFLEGMMISMAGCLSGMLAGLLFSLAQQRFGFIKMGENMVVDAYPVSLQWKDFLLVFATVTIIATLTSAISSRLSIKNLEELKKDL